MTADQALFYRFLAEHAFQFHPLANTATLVMSRREVARFAELTGHALQVIRVPEKQG